MAGVILLIPVAAARTKGVPALVILTSAARETRETLATGAGVRQQL